MANAHWMPAAARTSRLPARDRIRWDRISRVALLLVLLGVLALYINPVKSYWSTWQESKARSAEAAELKRENERLAARKNELRDPRALEREARRLGMVRAGERAYVLQGLPRER